VAHDYYPASLWQNEDEYFLEGNTNVTHKIYSHDLFTNLSLSWIEKQATNTQNPFFLYLAYTIPHAGGSGTTAETGEPVPSDAPYSEQPWPRVERNFSAMITRMDNDIGKIFSLLTQLKIDDNTVVFYKR